MWFNNALVYQYELDTLDNLQSALEEEKLKPCPPHARFIYGWLPPFTDNMVHEVAGSIMICMGKEERILPRGVVNKILEEKINLIELQQGRKVKRAEKAQLAEDLEFELLPKSFCVQKRLLALLDTVTNRLIINTSSDTQASQLNALLRKTVGITIEPLACPENLALRFAQWIQHPKTLPPAFQLASDCLLFSIDDEKKRIHCKGYELPAEEVLTLLCQGMAPAEVSLVWQEKIQFTLTQDLVFKKIKSLDYLVDDLNDINQLDEESQRQDAALTLLSGELRLLISELLHGIAHPISLESEEELTEELSLN